MMSDPINESFSALLDDEATSMDIQRLLNAMDSQPKKMAQWETLAASKAKMQNEVEVSLLSSINEELYQVDSEFNEKQAVDLSYAEKLETKPKIEESSGFIEQFKRTVASITVAATVCGASLIGFYTMQSSVVAVQSENALPMMAAAAPSQISAAMQQRLQELMQQRSQQASFTIPANQNQWKSVEAK